MNVLLLRWDTKPDKRIRGTFPTPDQKTLNAFLCRTACSRSSTLLPLDVLAVAEARAGVVSDDVAMGRIVITIPAVSIARELWRFGEPELALRAVDLTPGEAADIGERAGALQQSGDATLLWPSGPKGVMSAVLLAAIEHLEGRPRPCGRTRRLPEKTLPASLQVSEAERWSASEPVSREMDRRLHGSP